MADPTFGEPNENDMLLDTTVFHECLLTDKPAIKLPSGPSLMHSKFGWLLGGPLKTSIRDPNCFLSAHSF